MRVVGISGAGSGSGKTTLVESLLPFLPGWGALKTTPHLEPPCRPGPPCPGCPGRESGWRLCLDPAVLARVGSDTARFAAAGARRVAWLRAAPPLGEDARAAVRRHFEGCDGILAEGRRLVAALSPGTTIAIAAAGPSAPPLPETEALAGFDRVLIHLRDGADGSALLARAREAGRSALPWDGSPEGLRELAEAILSGPRRRS